MAHKGPRRVAWRDLDAEQRSCLQAISAAVENRQDAELRSWSEARRARDLGVPERMVAESLDVSRATLRRQLARRGAAPTTGEPPTTTAPNQPPSQPAQGTIAPALMRDPTLRRPSRQETAAREDLGLSPASTGQRRNRPVNPAGALREVAPAPGATRQPPSEERPEAWSPRCVIEAEGSELLPIVSDDVAAMSDDDVLAYWGALNDANRRALTKYLRDQQLHDQHSDKALMRLAVLLHRLHVRLRDAP